MSQEKTFVNGIIFKKPSPNAPQWIVGSIAIRVDELSQWMDQNRFGKEWINIDVKESKGGKVYCELSTYDPKNRTAPVKSHVQQEEESQEALNNMDTIEYPSEDTDINDIPF